MIHLILNFELGDVTIVADDEQIKAHKYLLWFTTNIYCAFAREILVLTIRFYKTKRNFLSRTY